MKLCMVNAFYHPYIGGSEKHMWELSRRLARKNEVHVVTSQWECEPGDYDLEGVKVHRLPTTFRKMPMIYPPPLPSTKGVTRKLEELDREFDFDAFNIHGRWFSDYNEVVWYAKKKGKLMVKTLHNQRPLGISPAVSIVGMTYEALRGKKILRTVDRIIAVSAAAKKDVMEYGLPETKFTVIHNGVDTTVYKPTPSDYLNIHKDGCDCLMLFVGRLIRQKGLHHLIAVMPDLLKEYPRTKLLIVGKGGDFETLKSKVHKHGLEKNIVFPGFIPDDKLPDLYSNADMFVLPSLWEVFPVAMLEALSCGAPLCSSDAGGNPEMVDVGKNGLIFRKGNQPEMLEKLSQMVGDPALRKHMSVSSRETALTRFDWEIITRKTQGFYDKAIAEHASGKR
jgi:1,4-alpha-glucan branching enzyme